MTFDGNDLLCEWDESTSAQPKSRKKLLDKFISYFMTQSQSSSDVDVRKLEKEFSEYICLFIARITAYLEHSTNVFYFAQPIKALYILSTSTVGQEYFLASPNTIGVLASCLDVNLNYDDKSLFVVFTFLRRIVSLNDDIRRLFLKHRSLESIEMLLLKYSTGKAIHAAGAFLILDLATIDPNPRSFSNILRALLENEELLPKFTALKMVSTALVTKSAVQLIVDGFEELFLDNIIRLLLSAPLTYQYDTAELLSILYWEPKFSNSVIRICSSVLCLRYTVGGNSLLQPREDWDMKFKIPDEYVLEVPEVLVCSALFAVLLSLKEAVRAKNMETFETITLAMRSNMLHCTLLAHSLWYIKERSVLHKVISMWIPDNSAVDEPAHDSVMHSPNTARFKKAVNLTKKWLSKKRFHRNSAPPDPNKAFMKVMTDSAITNTLDEHITEYFSTGTAESKVQDLCCSNVVRALQMWIEIDSITEKEIEKMLKNSAFTQMLHYCTPTSGSRCLDMISTLSNIIASSTDQMNKSFVTSSAGILKYLSTRISPGDLVKNLKLSLIKARFPQYIKENEDFSVNGLISESSTSTLETVGNDHHDSLSSETSLVKDFQKSTETEFPQLDSEVLESINNNLTLPQPPQSRSSFSSRRKTRHNSKAYVSEVVKSSNRNNESGDVYIFRGGNIVKKVDNSVISIKLPPSNNNPLQLPGHNVSKKSPFNLDTIPMMKDADKLNFEKLSSPSTLNFPVDNSESNVAERIRLKQLAEVVAEINQQVNDIYTEMLVDKNYERDSKLKKSPIQLPNVDPTVNTKSENEYADPLISTRYSPRKPLSSPTDSKRSKGRSPHKMATVSKLFHATELEKLTYEVIS